MEYVRATGTRHRDKRTEQRVVACVLKRIESLHIIVGVQADDLSVPIREENRIDDGLLFERSLRTEWLIAGEKTQYGQRSGSECSDIPHGADPP